MAEITATMVKALREETSQGMMECKKALTEAGGDTEKAKSILRKKGLATAEKKSSRDATEGLVAVQADDGGATATMVEIRCETDFCSRNEVFQAMVKSVAQMAAQTDGDGPIEPSDEITSAVQATFQKIGENMSFHRGIKITADRVGVYVHHNNKVAVLVGVDGKIGDDVLADLCMHVAFNNPIGITTDDIPADLVEKEKAIATEQAIDSGKPPEIAEKIVSGKIGKFMAANALLEQPFVRDDKKKVKDILGGATVKAMSRFAVGE